MSIQFKELRGDLVVAVPVAGQATPGTEDEFDLFVAPFDLQVVRAQWLPAADVTADPTNFFTLELRNRGGDGTGTAVPASRAYSSGDSSAHVAVDMTLSGTAADLQVAAGDVLTARKSTAGGGTGLAMPDGVVQLHYRIAG